MNKYKTFWPRLGAVLIDGIVLLPVSYCILYFQNVKDSASFLTWALVDIITYASYYVWFHAYSGQTIGKMFLKIRVVKLDETGTINYLSSLKRESLWIMTNISLSIYYFIKTTQLPSDINVLNDDYQYATELGIIIWVGIEILTMLLNPKRRAIHDFLAGSVVIKK